MPPARRWPRPSRASRRPPADEGSFRDAVALDGVAQAHTRFHGRGLSIEHVEIRGRPAAIAALGLEVGIAGVGYGPRQDPDLVVEAPQGRPRLLPGEPGVALLEIDLAVRLLGFDDRLRLAR